MKIAAVIAEYNPFHKGHSYHLEETRRLTGADFLLVVMSGSFVQRGAPAICNKYLRTRMALLNGADAVLELPSLYAVSSAEYFAQGAVSLLNNLGCITYLSFGSESGHLPLLLSCAGLLVSETEAYQKALACALRSGMTFPAARSHALLETAPEHSFLPDAEALKELLNSPNNILGLEYCKSLLASGSSITPFTVKRKGAGYHDNALMPEKEEFSSASAIRSAIEQGTDHVKDQLPSAVYNLLKENHVLDCPLTADDFSSFLYYRLLTEKENGFSQYLDCSEDLSAKICGCLENYRSFSSFCNLLKSKELTFTRISRILIHILLGITTPESYVRPFASRNLPAPYARLLGFKKDSSPLLASIKKNSSVPLISKLADAKRQLSPDDFSMLKQDLLCSSIYEAAHFSKTGKAPLNEYRQSPIVL